MTDDHPHTIPTHLPPCPYCGKRPCVCKSLPCRQYVDWEQLVPAETIEEFTAEYARRMGVTNG